MEIFPIEIWVEIFRFTSDPKDVRSLKLVCSDFKQCIEYTFDHSFDNHRPLLSCCRLGQWREVKRLNPSDDRLILKCLSQLDMGAQVENIIEFLVSRLRGNQESKEFVGEMIDILEKNFGNFLFSSLLKKLFSPILIEFVFIKSCEQKDYTVAKELTTKYNIGPTCFHFFAWMATKSTLNLDYLSKQTRHLERDLYALENAMRIPNQTRWNIITHFMDRIEIIQFLLENFADRLDMKFMFANFLSIFNCKDRQHLYLLRHFFPLKQYVRGFFKLRILSDSMTIDLGRILLDFTQTLLESATHEKGTRILINLAMSYCSLDICTLLVHNPIVQYNLVNIYTVCNREFTSLLPTMISASSKSDILFLFTHGCQHRKLELVRPLVDYIPLGLVKMSAKERAKIVDMGVIIVNIVEYLCSDDLDAPLLEIILQKNEIDLTLNNYLCFKIASHCKAKEIIRVLSHCLKIDDRGLEILNCLD